MEHAKMSLSRRLAALSLLTAATVVLLAAGCAAPRADEGFAIYLTRDNVSPSQMEMLSHVELADEPIISMDDVISYDASTHEMTLTGEAIKRIEELHVPTSGTSFMVCVDGGPVYWGAFWVLYSSLSFDGVTIWLPLILDEAPVVPIRMGYPGTHEGGAVDPRNAPRVLESFQTAGKLIIRPPARPTDALPQSFKGYELYSWQQDAEWHFTLITGTNRNKTIEEVLSPVPLVVSDGWVHIHAVGVEEITAALSRLPVGEHVFWFSEFYGEGGKAITLPPRDIVEAVASHAVVCGLDFVVAMQ
jgi:hypothetical protein